MKRLNLRPLFFAIVFFQAVGSDLLAQQYGKYTLISVQNTSTTQLIDTNSTVFKTWTHATNARTGYSSYLMPGGILWRTVQNQGNQLTGGGLTGKIQKVAWDGTVLWDFTYSSSTYCLHHDICPLPNGNVLAIAYDVKTAAQATQAGASQNIVVWSEKIIEIQPTGSTTGTIVWEWKAWDHLMQNVNPAKDNYVTSLVAHPEKLNINYLLKKDWIHMNGLDYNPKTNQVAFSSHYLNEWYVIDHSTTTAQAATGSGGNSGKGGDILYRFGNPAAYGATGTQILKVTHDVHWIPDDVPNTGRLVGFNNQGVSTSQSCVDQIMPPANGLLFDHTAGQAYEPTTYLQRTNCSGYSSNMGNSQQLPNGNMLICVATAGRVYEIDPNGNTLWTRTATGTVAQAFRYSECYVSTSAPAIPSISTSGNTLQATAAGAYQWFRNGIKIENATSQTYTATEPGFYVVRVNDANGCAGIYSYSNGIVFTPLANISLNLNTANNSICAGESANIQSQVTPAGGNLSYSWTSIPAGFTSSDASINPSPTVNTTYQAIVSNGTQSDTAEIAIQVNPAPEAPTLTYQNDTLWCSSGDAFAWYLDNNPIPGANMAWYHPTVSGLYSVKVQGLNLCFSPLSNAVNVTVTGVDNLRSASIRVVPNPAKEKFRILTDAGTEIELVQITQSNGKNVGTWTSTEIPVENLAPGMYFLHIRTNKNLLKTLPLLIQP